MLKKITLSILATTTLFFTLNVSANVKTSSLAIAKPSSTAKLPEQCQQMFKEADLLVRDAERQPGTHTQVSKMKSKLSVTKQKILKMEATLQQKSCDKGLVALNTMKKKH